jgi:hypothetical protein
VNITLNEQELADWFADRLWHAPVDPDLGFRGNCDAMGAWLAHALATLDQNPD